MAAESLPAADQHGLTHDDAAKKVQKVYRSYRTRRQMADSAIVAEELWWQAIEFARLNRSTLSFFDHSKPETMACKWSRVSFNVSKVGKGITKEEKAMILAFQHWIEAIDPRHRYGHNLHLYYKEWCNSQAGHPFFYWLDIGDGRRVDLDKCPRSLLRKQIVKYLGPLERENYEYECIEGKIMNKRTGVLLDTTQPEASKWIFVLSTTKKLYVGQKKKGNFHHSSFLAGGAAIAAGKLDAEDGDLKSICAYSGHYRPSDEDLDQFLSFLVMKGVNRDFIQVKSPSGEEYVQTNTKTGDDNVGEGTEKPKKHAVLDLVTSKMKQLQLEKIQIPVRSGKIEVVGIASQRAMSGGLKSPRPDVPQQAILTRMNSKKKVRSYQLGNQIGSRWCTGAGPRIGCIADYPSEVRSQALEFLSLSPRPPAKPKHVPDLVSA